MKGKYVFIALMTSLVLGAAITPTMAEPLTVFAGDTLQVRFHLPQVPTASLCYDTFWLGSGSSATEVSADFSIATIQLFAGGSLLGTYSAAPWPLPALFKAEDSLWDNGQNPTIIDFTSFLDGSIDGLLLLTVDNGHCTFESGGISVGIGHATGSSSSTYYPADQPVITEISIRSANTDTDGDGVPDGQDACPDVFGEAAYGGCPTPQDDIDGDGIPNEEDQCPEVPGSAAFGGCPPPRPTRTATVDLVLNKMNYQAWVFHPFDRIWYVYLHALIENRSFETAKNISVRFRVGSHLARDVTVKSLDPGEALWVSVVKSGEKGICVQPGEYTLQVMIDPHNQIPELDESNNVYQVPVVLGDD